MSDSKPNVLVYVFDSLRADHLSCYGYTENTTPNIDSVANEGVIFSNAFSQAYWTPPSSASILTGLYPQVHGMHRITDAYSSDADLPTEYLQDAGYHTGAFSATDGVSEMRNLHRGFERFEELFAQHDPSDSDTAKICANSTIDWVADAAEPFFGFVWTMGTHVPFPNESTSQQENAGSLDWLKQKEYEERQDVVDVYDDAIQHTDEEFGRVLNTLKSQGLYEDTLLIIIADHGEVLSEHGRLEYAHPAVEQVGKALLPSLSKEFKLWDQYGYLGHEAILPYDELINVPLIIKPPGGIDSSRRVEGLTETIDVIETIVDFADVNYESQGVSLAGVLNGNAYDGKDYVFSDSRMNHGNVRYMSIRDKKYKLINKELEGINLGDIESIPRTAFSVASQFLTPSELLLGTEENPEKEVSVQREVLDNLQSTLTQWENQNRAYSQPRSEQIQVEEGVADRLEDLGYVS